MLREKTFTRADGLVFTLLKAGRQTLLWQVTKDEKGIRWEVWPLHRRCYVEDYYEDEIKIFYTIPSAEKFFENNEHKQ
ncbi:MAG: hypothetical protein WC389_18600 [Lutibacter sp.]|jgi:hypothetical protein